jgi:aromatic-L-amino-acid decarboxylase
MTDAAADFDWSATEIRRVGERVAALISDHVTALETAGTFIPVPADHAAKLRSTPVPWAGSGIDAVLDEFARDISPYPFGNGHPRFFGWVNSPPALAGVFAEALAAAMNPSVAGGNHAAVYVEHAVASWLTRLVGFPATSKGLLVSGASAAAIIALNAARYAACTRAGWNIRGAGLQPTADGRTPPRMLAYKSAEGHGCHQKAIELLGIGSDNLRSVPADAALRLDAAALDSMLAADRRAGHLPFAVIASAGTVNTGVIDPLSDIADVCARHAVWLHVDGAYGAMAILTAEYQRELAALSRADSVALDPHKWLYVPVDAGFIVVRDADVMRHATSLVPPYLRTDGDEGGVQGPPWLSEYGIEQTRSFRALKVWFSLKTIGVDGYRRLLEHDIAMARYLADTVRADDTLELWQPQEMSIVCFRVRGAHGYRGDDTATDRLNRAVLSAIQLGGEAFVSGTVLDGRFWLRACVINPRTRQADIDRLLQVVRRARSAVFTLSTPES